MFIHNSIKVDAYKNNILMLITQVSHKNVAIHFICDKKKSIDHIEISIVILKQVIQYSYIIDICMVIE